MSMISVVIPTLEVAGKLQRSLPPLASLDALSLIREVILADGGSTDPIAAIAEESGAMLLQAPRGRGQQLAAGADAARGDWLLFLHADTALSPDWHVAVRRFIEDSANSGRAGYFRFGLDDDRFAARCLESAVAIRCALLRLPYGDQGLLIARPLYRALGGFRPMPLMEDVDMVRRLGRHRLRPIATRAETSAARYRRDGYLLRPLRNLACLSLYLLGLPPRMVARLYG